jgi:hypothetical protein
MPPTDLKAQRHPKRRKTWAPKRRLDDDEDDHGEALTGPGDDVKPMAPIQGKEA